MADNTILLFLANTTNQNQLRDWLQSRYQIIEGHCIADLQQPFQLCIIDGQILDRYEAAIQERRSIDHPLFLPFLLITSRRDVQLHTRHLWRTIDELVISPIQKVELHARIEILLRARRLALEVNQLQQSLLVNIQMWLRLAVQSAHIGLWEWDLTTNRVFFSPEWKAQLGYEAHEIIDTFEAWEERLHPDDRERCLNTINRYLRQPWPDFTLEFRLRHKDGSYHWIQSQAALIYDQHGRPTHMLGAHVDLTARKQMEEEQRQLTEQLFQAQKFEAIGSLVSGIAHDLNNLLVPIIGFAEIGMLEAPPEGELYANFDQIRAAGIRATALTRQILAFSRRQRLELKLINLNQVISDFAGILRRLIDKRITIDLHLSPNLLPIMADAGQIEQVLLNLVINARDAISGNGTVTITTSLVRIDEKEVQHVPNLAAGRYVMLQVQDTGCGIDPAILPRIFEPFFTTKPQGQGTGLGLATVFGIVKQYYGHIDVQSVLGEGTIFTIYLPAFADVAPIAAHEPFTGERLIGHETVLVVEDEPAVLHLIASALRLYGYRVLEALDPQRGMGIANSYEGAIDLLISDVTLPMMTGDELYRRLTAQRPGMRVLYVSAYAGNEPISVSSERLLTKPFTLQQLLQRVRAVLTVG